ncbi:hypothetical protein AT959_14545 [Dechloromonas denitrificans]|uniref:Uncharacterized protein n=1 Tax=Dechloromonas denitrificans TaxID=281362 RepID=A0A133XHX1_9RHOO|nr:hypothetical protein AT959_14545 [Dechloromonas denitrificans]
MRLPWSCPMPYIACATRPWIMFSATVSLDAVSRLDVTQQRPTNPYLRILFHSCKQSRHRVGLNQTIIIQKPEIIEIRSTHRQTHTDIISTGKSEI